MRSVCLSPSPPPALKGTGMRPMDSITLPRQARRLADRPAGGGAERSLALAVSACAVTRAVAEAAGAAATAGRVAVKPATEAAVTRPRVDLEGTGVPSGLGGRVAGRYARDAPAVVALRPSSPKTVGWKGETPLVANLHVWGSSGILP
mmetsp:Transcript_99380/g.286818  ORF Transcript_99380/g.286818 Transcript_99380/m.286818 type:complete len:148 (+) Transcript_99380:932-1375(+)